MTELGAGTGVLAHDILTHCESSLPQFYAQLTYVIGERSHALGATGGDERALRRRRQNRPRGCT